MLTSHHHLVLRFRMDGSKPPLYRVPLCMVLDQAEGYLSVPGSPKWSFSFMFSVCTSLCATCFACLIFPNLMLLIICTWWGLTKEGLRNMQKQMGTPSTPFHNMAFCSNRQQDYNTNQFVVHVTVRRQASKGGSTVHTPLSVVCLFQKCPQWLQLWMYFQQSKYFWKWYSAARLCQSESSSNDIMLSAAVYSVREHTT